MIALTGAIMCFAGCEEKKRYGEMPPNDPLKLSAMQIVNHTFKKNIHGPYGYRELLAFDTLIKSRSIQFTAHIPLRSILRKDETLNDLKTDQATAFKHAKTYAKLECARLKRILVRDCEPRNFSTRFRSNFLRIDARLFFTQSFDFGKIERSVPLRLVTVTTNLNTREQLSTVGERAEEDRSKFYAMALEMCERVRKEQGNCALTKLNIHSHRQPGSDSVNLSGMIDYTTLVPDNQ